MKDRILLAASLMALGVALAPNSAHAATCSVPSGSYPTIQSAVNNVNCATINLAAGTFFEDVTIARSVDIYGSGAMSTTVNGKGLNSVFNIANSAFVFLTQMTITNGVSTNGGGISIGNSANVGVTNSAVHANTGGSHGGGIFVGSGAVLQLINSTVDANHAGGTGNGGGISNFGGTVYVVNSTISGNSANVDGGGIANEGGSGGLVKLLNATVAFNYSDADLNGSGSGGGVDNFSPNTLVFENSIIANNLESDFDPESSRWFRLPGDCGGTLTSFGYNILSINNCAVAPTTGDHINTDPKLGALANNGGPTQTHALFAGSPAIDAGDPAGCVDHNNSIMTNDQRLWARPYPAGGRCDIGAYERGAFVDLPLISR